MITGPETNPYINFRSKHPGLLCLSEVPIAVIRLRNSFEQRRVDINYAQSWLDQVVKIGIDNDLTDVFQEQDRDIKVTKKIGSGFFTSVFGFETSMGSWVLKIGARKSPVPGWLDPSCEEYANWYAQCLKTMRSIYDDSLPNLIPKPQYVMYPNKENEVTSIVIQPLIPSVEPLSKIHTKEPEVKRAILNELETFYAKSELLRKDYGIFPDLGSNNNLVLAKNNNEYHLTLIDNNPIDLHAISPVMNAYNLIRYHGRLRGNIAKLKRT